MDKEEVKEENIIKKTCKELGITQKELAVELGVSKPSVDRWASTGDIPESSSKLISFFIENQQLKNEILEMKNALQTLKKYGL